MKTALFISIVFIALLLSCTHSEKLEASDATYVSEYKGKRHVKTSRYRLDGSLSSVSYFTPLGIMDSVYTIESNGNTRFAEVRERESFDSIFLYDTSSVLVKSWHYKNEVPYKIVLHQPNGIRDSALYISRVDTIEIPDKITPVINIEHLYSGVVLTFYENGNLKSRGPYEKSKPSGIWIYYRENGEIEKSDTLR